MIARIPWFTVGLIVLSAAATRAPSADAPQPPALPIPQKVEFNRDIRPILSDACFYCHGPDKNHRKAGVRLDVKEGLFAARKRVPVLPGKPADSEFFRRITTKDEDDLMPPPDSGKKLTPRQIALIGRWIEQGAPYQGHWSYEKPAKPAPPAVSEPNTSVIDAFLAQKLKEKGIAFAPQADRRTLARRLYFDLLGLPPTPAQVEAFVIDTSPRAYENLVESLLANPHFGERLAVYWLDLVRYADTIGYHSDNPRQISPYRDWVIAAFNANMPFDRFTREQLAGDLLPNPTTDQKVASAYNRLLQTTEEGGAQPKEYAAKYLSDRVRNVSAVWLAGTMLCAECHDHKFDPYTMRDFYSLAAFFADVSEPPVGKRGEGMLIATPEQQAHIAQIDQQIADAKKRLDASTPELAAAQAQWEKDYHANPKKPPATPKGAKAPAKEAIAALAIPEAQRTKPQKAAITAYYRTIAPLLEPVRQEIARLEKQRADYIAPIRKVLVSQPGALATVRILPRGNWNTDSGEIVAPAVPHFLPQIALPNGQRPTRLDLANWLVSRDNPLTARVFVNRLWKLFFGTGLSKTLEDLGSQGEWPTHPELLDYLAVEFQDSGWDIKHMIRLLVTSQAYRQTSIAPAPLREADPFNRLLARQSRFRLDAEFIRDNALFVAGLLNETIGGESVRPYQPDGYWDFLNFPKRTYVADTGAAQYRRGLYAWWQRTFPQPSLVNFDAPSREECTCERPRSNTPQQALTLLNDPTYVEAARAFAQRIMSQPGDTPARVAWAIQQALQRPAKPQEIQLLSELYARLLKQYQADPSTAAALLKTGQAPIDPKLDPAQLAAWTNVARTLFNLHETITRN